MNYAAIKKFDIANGPGVRVSLFVSGCRRKCKNCFNKEAWSFDYGSEIREETIAELIDAMKPEHIEGFSLLGGEPFEPENQQGVLSLLTVLRKEFPDKSFWCYSGFLFEDLYEGKVGNAATVREIFELIDVLVDGPYIESGNDASLLFRGSKNQRILDMKKTLMSGKAVIKDGKWQRKMGSGSIYE